MNLQNERRFELLYRFDKKKITCIFKLSFNEKEHKDINNQKLYWDN